MLFKKTRIENGIEKNCMCMQIIFTSATTANFLRRENECPHLSPNLRTRVTYAG